jgi:SnoaL-like domain
MTNVNETVVRYIAAWNERDPKRRRDLVAETWAEDGSYIDAHRGGKGHSAIDAMLATTQARFPGYRISLVSGIEAHNNFVRFSWAADGTSEAPLYLGGTDFATLAADGRIKVVAGFTDAAPAAVK